MNLLRLKVVLAAIDYDDASRLVLEASRTLADAAGAKLHVVHVDQARAVSEVPPDERGGASLDTALAQLGRANVKLDRAQVHIIAGEPARVIRALSDRIRADVIALGPHREDRQDERRIGSTALAIATESWAPCLIVTQGFRLPLMRVLVPVDLSDTARGALMVALSWSSALRAGNGASDRAAGTGSTSLTALYVDRSAAAGNESVGAPRALDAELERVRQGAGTWAGVAVVGVTVAAEDVATAIADCARDNQADLIVLGTRGLGLDAVGRLGSVSEAVIRRVGTPVLLVPPAVWTEFAKQSR